MEILQYRNSIFSSNTYLLFKKEFTDVWLIDPGDTDQIIGWIEGNSKIIKGILLTHSHFDHIYGVNYLVKMFPEISIYASFHAKEGLYNEKLNGSLYKEIPFIIKKQDIIIVKDNDLIELWKGSFLKVIETPGHGRDCLSFEIEKNLFTGDALIPGIKVFTKRKYGDKDIAQNSITRIFDQFDDLTIIWPGHERSCLLGDLKS
jgi:hydroxyacylglutathione hydrolase